MQMQMHLETMHQQSIFITTTMYAIMGNQSSGSIVPPLHPPIGFNIVNQLRQREEGACKERGEGKSKESNGE